MKAQVLTARNTMNGNSHVRVSTATLRQANQIYCFASAPTFLGPAGSLLPPSHDTPTFNGRSAEHILFASNKQRIMTTRPHTNRVRT